MQNARSLMMMMMTMIVVTCIYKYDDDDDDDDDLQVHGQRLPGWHLSGRHRTVGKGVSGYH